MVMKIIQNRMLSKLEKLREMRLITPFSETIEYYWLAKNRGMKIYLTRPLEFNDSFVSSILDEWVNEARSSDLDGLIVITYWNTTRKKLVALIKQKKLAGFIDSFSIEAGEKSYSELVDYLLGKKEYIKEPESKPESFYSEYFR